MHKNLVATSQKTLVIFITKTNWLTVFREVLPLDCKNHMKITNTLCRIMHGFVCFLLGNSLVSEVYMLTFRNTLSVPSS